MNPLRAQLSADRTPAPATVVIFGASGDLTKRKLVPALYNLMLERHLSRIAIVGTSRSQLSDEAFRQRLEEGVDAHSRRRPIDRGLWESMARSVHYQPVDFGDPAMFRELKTRLEAIEKEHNLPGNRLFYLSTPPSVFAPIIRNLGEAGLVNPGEDPFARVVIEKPFGTDLASAQSLNHQVHQVLEERQIYRIDHYLGKETVQNLLVFRYANSIFEPMWNNKYVRSVQITGAETLGVEQRGSYFEKAGILRDMVQNHLFQVLCLAAMEPPASFDADAVRDEKTKVLKALRPVTGRDVDDFVLRGQYTKGSVLGRDVAGYREEANVDPDSRTETYVALKLGIDNWRWAGVPFYLRSAKRMPKKVTEIAVHFRPAPHRLFGDARMAHLEGNVLAIRIQPDEGITLTLGSKVPGQAIEIAPVSMEFRYASSFGVEAPEAYERLLLDALNGEPTLFTRGDEVEASWRFITPIHEAWSDSDIAPFPYEAGSWGPPEAEALLTEGMTWRKP